MDAEDLWIEAWPDCRAANRQNVCLTTYLDHRRPPGIDCRQIIDHDGNARVSLNVAVLLAPNKAVAADVNCVLVRVDHPCLCRTTRRRACIALFSETCEARATLATNPEGPVLSFSTDWNIVAEIGVAVIDPATPKAGYIGLARGNGDPLLHLRLDSDGHLFTEGL